VMKRIIEGFGERFELVRHDGVFIKDKASHVSRVVGWC